MGGAVEELQLQRPQTHLDVGYVMLPNLANFGHEPPLQRHHSAPACVHCLAKWQGKVGQSGESVQPGPSPSPSRSAASVEQVETHRCRRCGGGGGGSGALFYANFVAF